MNTNLKYAAVAVKEESPRSSQWEENSKIYLSHTVAVKNRESTLITVGVEFENIDSGGVKQ